VVPGPSAIAANLALAKGVAASATTMLAGSIFDDKLAVVVPVIGVVQGVAKVVATRHLSASFNSECEEQKSFHGYYNKAARKMAGKVTENSRPRTVCPSP